MQQSQRCWSRYTDTGADELAHIPYIPTQGTLRTYRSGHPFMQHRIWKNHGNRVSQLDSEMTKHCI